MAAFALTVLVVQGLSVGAKGDLPLGVRQLDASRREVTAVSPAAARAGLRVGDVYDWRDATPDQRAARNRWLASGDRLVLPVRRHGVATPVALVAMAPPAWQVAADYADLVFKALGFAVGILLVARGKGRFGVFSGLTLYGFAAVEGYNVSYVALPHPYGIVLYAATIGLGNGLRYLQIEAMIAICGPALTRGERYGFRAITLPCVALLCASSFGLGYQALTGKPTVISFQWILAAQLVFRVDLIGFIIAMLRTRRHDRALLSWVFWSSAIGLSGPTVNLVLGLMSKPLFAFGALNLTLFSMGFGYAYVALRYRVVDLSFVLNRAVVYGVVLAFVVGVFTLAETVTAKLAFGKVNSLVVELAIGLGLGLGLRQLERRVDNAVERTLFVRKHRMEEGLRALIRDLPHVEDADQLLAHLCSETRRLVDAHDVIVYERVESRLVPVASTVRERGLAAVSIDDPVFVRLRSALQPVALGKLETAIPVSGIVFPMLARGRMLGAMVCAAKSARREYDPDERALLAELAHEAGVSLLFLRTTALSMNVDASQRTSLAAGAFP